MGIYKETKDYKLIHDNMLNMENYIENGTIDCVITDPPYELGFMGKKWDGSGIAFNVDAWKKCFNALKDGGYLLAFGGTRTFHRIACAIEDAGFEIRDTIMYLYGSGFPKSHNIGLAVDKLNGVESKVLGGSSNARPNSLKENNLYQAGTVGKEFCVKQAQNEWQGWGTALKPAYEPIIVARKPMKTSVAENVIKNKVGGINIDECRIPFEDTQNPATNPLYRQQNKDKYKQIEKGQESKGAVNFTSSKNDISNLGRFPANIIHDGSDEVVSGFPETSSGLMTPKHTRHTDGSPNGIYGKFDVNHPLAETYGDSGNASRFFYTAKASKKDRDEGLDVFEFKRESDRVCDDGVGGDNPRNRTNKPRKNTHPTVKPVELMQYLVRLVAPKGATILDCFMGSGSTGKAAMFENRERNAKYKFIGIELTDEYLPICEARIEYAINKYEYDEKAERAKTGQISLFDELGE